MLLCCFLFLILGISAGNAADTVVDSRLLSHYIDSASLYLVRENFMESPKSCVVVG